jgi:hypothetical protein
MVEYAILVAHNSASIFSRVASDVSSWSSRLDWGALLYALLGLVLLRAVFGAFSRPRL